MVLRRAILILVGLGVPAALDAQVILGRVIDARSKVPIRGVTIALLTDTGSTEHQLARASADTLGLFYLDVPTPGRYRLSFNVGDREAFIGVPIDVAGEEIQREFALEHSWLESEVDKKVSAKAGNRAPRYPLELRAREVNGEVCAEFVVDTSGRAMMSTFKTLQSTDPQFSDAVRTAVTAFQFSPAEVQHRAVAQLVRMPFTFAIGAFDAEEAKREMATAQARCK